MMLKMNVARNILLVHQTKKLHNQGSYVLKYFSRTYFHQIFVKKLSIHEAITLICLNIPFEHKTGMLDFKLQKNYGKITFKTQLTGHGKNWHKVKFFGSEESLLIPHDLNLFKVIIVLM